MWNLEVPKNKIKVLKRGKTSFFLSFFFFLNKQLCTTKACYGKKKKSQQHSYKRNHNFKKIITYATVEFGKGSSHIHRRVRAIGSATPRFFRLPRGTCRTMWAQSGYGRDGGQRREGGDGNKGKADAQHGRRAFFSLFEILDVNRKPTEATCKIDRVLQILHWQNKRLFPQLPCLNLAV